MKKLILAAGIASLGLAASALAGGSNTVAPVTNNSWYVGVNGGVGMPRDNFWGDQAGVDLGAQIGYRMRNWRAEAAYNYYDGGRFSTVMANGYYDFRNSSKFIPYVGAGLGWSYSEASGGGFAYQGIMGVDYQLTKHTTIGLNYRYVDASVSANVVNATLNYYFN